MLRSVLRSLLIAGCVFSLGACALASKAAPTPGAKAASAADRPDSSELPAFLSPPEIMKRMEASAVQYRIEPKDSPPGGWAEELWPMRVEPVPVPRVVVEDGRRVIEGWKENSKAQALMNKAEEHFQARRYAEAAKLYQQALDICADCYLARAYLGDTLLFGGDLEGALEHYRKAAEINPHDYRLYYFQGSALARLGRGAEAREAFAWSLVLNPRNPVLRRFFRENPGAGMWVRGDVLVPRGFAHEEGKEVVVEFDPDYGVAWFAYANCKALWLGEASHREERTGTAERHFSSAEELECLASAAVVHASQREKGEEGAMDSSLDGLVAIIQDGMATELVLFEMAARVHPQYTLTLDDAERQRLKDYVLRYVLVSTVSL
ncbi:tetratricopeptide repeat protein [Hyalangium sp.]|uniref:tetratricopeptide repeat protein n=1 Tax=Hyalangium sp. TaxID=2028555 RepID=UPI002D694BB7|nr:tetratricopeptide repeat protein [Hyalangium sp.]HYH99675.1 tetratricopeptide repeat protein [Hyalangium sp.]